MTQDDGAGLKLQRIAHLYTRGRVIYGSPTHCQPEQSGDQRNVFYKRAHLRKLGRQSPLDKRNDRHDALYVGLGAYLHGGRCVIGDAVAQFSNHEIWQSSPHDCIMLSHSVNVRISRNRFQLHHADDAVIRIWYRRGTDGPVNEYQRSSGGKEAGQNNHVVIPRALEHRWNGWCGSWWTSGVARILRDAELRLCGRRRNFGSGNNVALLVG